MHWSLRDTNFSSPFVLNREIFFNAQFKIDYILYSISPWPCNVVYRYIYLPQNLDFEPTKLVYVIICLVKKKILVSLFFICFKSKFGITLYI